MRTRILDGQVIHDYRQGMLGWGWNILNMTKISDFTAMLMGVGKGVDVNHIIVVSNEKHGNIALEVQEIKYDTNPKDLYQAKVKSIGCLED